MPLTLLLVDSYNSQVSSGGASMTDYSGAASKTVSWAACKPCPCEDGTQPTCSDAGGDEGKWVCADGTEATSPGCETTFATYLGQGEVCRPEDECGLGYPIHVRVVNGLPYPISINSMWHTKNQEGNSMQHGDGSDKDAEAYGRPVDKCSFSDWTTMAHFKRGSQTQGQKDYWWIKFTT